MRGGPRVRICFAITKPKRWSRSEEQVFWLHSQPSSNFYPSAIQNSLWTFRPTLHHFSLHPDQVIQHLGHPIYVRQGPQPRPKPATVQGPQHLRELLHIKEAINPKTSEER